MAHIHTDPNQHDPTVTAYIVRVDTPKPQVLVHMHRKHGMLLPVGGHVELHETPWQAMAHELSEESGYDISQLKVLQPKSRIASLTKVVLHPVPLAINTHYIDKDHFHTDLQYALVANGLPTGNLEDGESSDLRWLDSDELDAQPLTAMYASTKEIYRFMLDEALPNWDRVSASDFALNFPEDFRRE